MIKLSVKTFAVILVAFLATFILGSSKPVQALTISPIRIELDANPGQSLSSSVKIFNENSESKLYYIYVARFETKDETGQPTFVQGQEGLPSWVDVQSSVLAPAKEFQEIPFQINVPFGATPGGYFAAIFVSTVPVDGAALNNIKFNSDVGTLLLFRVNGEFKEGETILDFTAQEKWSTSLPVEFFYRFQNAGEDRSKPLGDITIKNIFGRTSKLINANPSAGNTLPRSIRKYSAAWLTNGGEVDSLGEVKYLSEDASWMETLKWQWQHFALGRYSANLHLTVNNDSSRSYEASTAIWIIPWQLLITIIGGLIIIFGSATGLALLVVWYVFKKQSPKARP